MIEEIQLEHFEVLNNFVLVRVDPNYDFKEIPGPNGTVVQLKIIDNSVQNDTENISISGKVLKVPAGLDYHTQLRTHRKGVDIAADEFESLMRTTMPHDVDLDVTEGDRVYFNYTQGLDAETECRLLRDENGYVMLMPYHELFGREDRDMVVPINGWVFFKRDRKPETVLESGIILLSGKDKYESPYGTVVISAPAARSYLQPGASDNKMQLQPGDRIMVQNKFGYRMASDLHGGKLAGIECVKRKNIVFKINESAKSVQDYVILT